MAPRIAVMGSGGIGGYFGGRLAAAGEDVHFIARGAHLAAMQADGLQLRSPLGNAHVTPVQATDDPATIGPVDVVMFCVKLYDVEAAAELCKPLLGPDTAVISFLNGIDSEERMRAILGDRHVVGGVAHIPSTIAAPGVIEHKATLAALQFGEADSSDSERLTAFHAACEGAGIQASLVPDIDVAIWSKFVVLAAFAAVCCLTRQPAAVISGHDAVTALFRDLVAETIAVALARGVALPADAGERAMQALDNFPPTVKPSMLVDLEAGRRIEIEGLSGAVLRSGATAGVDTPAHRLAYAALLPWRDGPPAQA